jgi:cytochrome c553
MKRWTRIALIVGGLAAAGFLVAASGVISIKASSGHWPITEWLLEFGKRRSVDTHTLGMAPLALDEPWLVLKGAGHYETSCRSCHGAPGHPVPTVAQAMTPSPKHLAPLIAKWDPEELFYIVKHGIKLTGMPAWPSQQRDDEVGAVVAFLLALPDLDATAYERLVFGERAATVPTDHGIAASCARCHGTDGRGRESAAFPRLAGQSRDYLQSALAAYASGDRHSGMMRGVAAELTPEESRALADHYSRLPSAPSDADPPDDDSPVTTLAIERGREIATRGIAAQRVPICKDCHGPEPKHRNPAYPSLAGQYADYLVLQLELFAAGRRGGSRFAHLMDHAAPHLRPEQMRDVAAYYASLLAKPESSGR